MASYKRFEDLPVWNKAADLAALMLDWTTRPVFGGKGDLANQIRRATLWVSNNFAEGVPRGSTTELLQYIDIARRSAGGLRSMPPAMEPTDAFDDLTSEISQLPKHLD